MFAFLSLNAAHPSSLKARLLLFFAGVTPYHALVFLGCWLGGLFDGLDSSLYIVVQADALGQLLHTTDRALISQAGSWVIAIFLMGWTLGGITFGYFSDRFGRVPAMVFSILIYALFTGACGLAQDPYQLAVFRFLTGFGIGGELVTITTMLTETWPHKSRAFAIGLLITSYQVGVFLAGLIPALAYQMASHLALPPWRLVFFIGVLPAIFAIILRQKLEEPELWLEEQAKLKQAAALSDAPAVSHEAQVFKRLTDMALRKDLILGAVLFGALLVGYWASLAWIPTWIQDLLGTQGNGSEKSMATMWHGLAAVGGCCTAGLLAHFLGRKTVLLGGFVGIIAATALLMLSNPVFSPAIYWQNALLGYMYGVVQATLYIYLPELFPTLIRATAVGVCLNTGRIVTVLAVLSVSTLVGLTGGYANTLLLFSLVFIPAFIATLFAKETKGKPLPL
jgi:MFS family permease